VKQTVCLGYTLSQLSVFTIYGTCDVASRAECFVLLHQHFPQCVCCAQYGCFLYTFLISCFPGTLLRYFLNDFEMVQVAPIITGIAFVCIFHMRCVSVVRFLYYYCYYYLFMGEPAIDSILDRGKVLLSSPQRIDRSYHPPHPSSLLASSFRVRGAIPELFHMIFS
jgi:hypothetical protein